MRVYDEMSMMLEDLQAEAMANEFCTEIDIVQSWEAEYLPVNMNMAFPFFPEDFVISGSKVIANLYRPFIDFGV